MEVVHVLMQGVAYFALIAVVVVAACAVGCLQRLDAIASELRELREALGQRAELPDRGT